MVYAWYSNPNPDVLTKLMKVSMENYNNTHLSICNTAFIFGSMNDTNPKINMFCGPTAANWTYYRTAPVTTSDALFEFSYIIWDRVTNSLLDACCGVFTECP
jgi:hypothetical protein